MTRSKYDWEEESLEEDELWSCQGLTMAEWEHWHRRGAVPPEACSHEIVDTGMKIGWCKHCDADFVLNTKTQKWELKK